MHKLKAFLGFANLENAFLCQHSIKKQKKAKKDIDMSCRGMIS